jgi:hypothetical protein
MAFFVPDERLILTEDSGKDLMRKFPLAKNRANQPDTNNAPAPQSRK